MTSTDAAQLFNSMSQNPASNDEAKRDKRPSDRLSASQIERAAQMLRAYELRHVEVGYVSWENLNEKIKQHFRGKVRVVVDAVSEA